jgi:hypothetical protein
LQGLAKLRKKWRNRDRRMQGIGAVKQLAGKSSRCGDINRPPQGSRGTVQNGTLQLNRDDDRKMLLRDGMYLLRTNMTETAPDVIWLRYVLLTEIQAAFRCLKSDLAVRPV